MLNVVGLCGITKIEECKGGKSLKATLYFQTKQVDGTKAQNYFDCFLVGDAVTEVISKGIKNKDYVIIIDGTLQTQTYNGKTSTKITVFKLELAPPKEDKKADTKGGDNNGNKSKFDR